MLYTNFLPPSFAPNSCLCTANSLSVILFFFSAALRLYAWPCKPRHAQGMMEEMRGGAAMRLLGDAWQVLSML